MNYLAMLMMLLQQVPTIAAIVHNTNPAAPVESKITAAGQLLGVAATVATGAGQKGTIVSQALTGASAVLTATVQAIHNAGTQVSTAVAPPPTPAPSSTTSA
jgi:hypothetical protein